MIVRLTQWLKSKMGLDTPDPESGLDEEFIQNEFKKRYHNFRLLLTANKKTLRIITDMEMALHENRTFGMSFIKAQSTAASVNVYSMVKHLSAIAPGKYDELFNRIKEIQAKIQLFLEQTTPAVGTQTIIDLAEVTRDMADQVGGKMANLGEIMRLPGLKVPEGFVITSLAYHEFFKHSGLKDEIYRLLQSAGADDQENLLILSAQIRQMVTQAEIPHELAKSIKQAYARLAAKVGPATRVSLRSSALGEDAHGQTFAGQFSSKLNVAPQDIIETYKEIISSKYTPQAMTYRLSRGIPDEDIAMCVGCMAMVSPQAGGVIYSRNPLNHRDDSVFVYSTFGLPKTVVDGSVESDVFVLARAPQFSLTRKTIRPKEVIYHCDPEGGVCRRESSGEAALAESLSEEKSSELAKIAVDLEHMHDSPVDVEWAMTDSGEIFILQCRPLTQVESSERPAGQGGVHAELEILGGGVTGSPGVACGPICLVRREADLLRFPQGAILVALDARPRWASVMNIAAGIITERGSAAGHLSNVAREFHVPALMGLKGALTALSDGQEVTLDADGRGVYRGRVEELMALARPRQDDVLHTPLHGILRKVMDNISPLHLIDPSSPDFTPENCRTLHDITRFCHEKSVHEMFRFGQDFHFSKRASKQLKHNVPMKWWFVNLDDGFKEEVKGKYVTLDNIACIPMHALWDGMVAVPWSGPPPVDGKGFMSIVAQAASNPNLEASTRSDYADRNYFMISKHYMCLSSRFGFHFCTVEALVDERERENYISFQLKGGAAEFERRRRRAEFTGRILERYDFGVEVQEDSIMARLAKGPMDFMLSRMLVVGYLLMHTRQLDMVMTNNALVERYHTRFCSEIDAMLAKSPYSEAGLPASPQ